jgi:hypothetical protein
LEVEAIRLEQPPQSPRHKARVCKDRALLLTAVAVVVELVGHHQPEEAAGVAVEQDTPTLQGLPE